MYWTEFLTIAVAHLFAVASPGPDFAVVMRQCVSSGTRAGILTSLGVGAGILLHVGYCLLGVALVISRSPQLFQVLKWLAAAYLFYLGVRAIHATLIRPDDPAVALNNGGLAREKGAEIEEAGATEVRPWRAVVLGFLTNGLNPKATLFFLALFTVVIDPATPTRIQAFYGLYLAVATFAWFASLSMLLGHAAVRSALLSAGVWFERGMGVVLILLAVQIALFPALE